MHPQQIGGPDFEDAREEIEQLPLLDDRYGVALQGLERISKLAPTLRPQVYRQVQQRLGPDGVRMTKPIGAEASMILEGLARIYIDGRAAYFSAVCYALDRLAAEGHHLPRREAVATLRSTAAAVNPTEDRLDAALGDYSSRVLSATHSCSRSSKGLYVMTMHQAKGKEFDSVVICDVSSRYFPDNDESRKLLYVAITRASSAWTIVAPSNGASPLLECLGL